MKKKTASLFTPKEILALKIMARELAEYCREDIAGAILYTGAFHALPDDDSESVVALAQKLTMTRFEKQVTSFGTRVKKNQSLLHFGKVRHAKAGGNLLGK